MLTPGDLAGRACRGAPVGLRLGIPIYADPDLHPATWTGVEGAPAGTAVIVNPDTGPGRFRDARYAARVVRLHERGHVVYGYVDTAYGTRARTAIAADIVRHQGWFGIDGIFFDQVPGGADHLAQYADVAGIARARGLGVAFNMGQASVDPRYGELADILAVFEGPGSAHAAASFPDWMHLPGRRAHLWHLVFGVPGERAMGDALARAASGPCEIVFVTDGLGPNPWRRLPTYWERELALIGDARRSEDP